MEAKNNSDQEHNHPISSASLADNTNVSSKNQNVFPFTGIFSPGGFLSTFSSSTNEPTQTSDGITCPNLMSPVEIESTENRGTNNSLNISEQTPGSGSGSETQQSGMEISLFLGHDHILKNIFSLLDIHDLCNCRRVCHRYKSFSTPFLQKRARIYFLNFQLRGDGASLRELTSLLQQHSIQNQDLSTFPFRTFEFAKQPTFQLEQNILRNDMLNDFLQVYGSYIRKLTLFFYYYHDEICLHEMEVFEKMQNLLLHQAPNLHTLCIHIPSKVEWKHSDANRNEDSALRLTDPEYEEIREITSEYKVLNHNLKILKYCDGASAKVLEGIILISPNLRRIILEERNHVYYYKPANRFRFLQELSVDPYSSIDIHEKTAWAIECYRKQNQNEPNLQLEKLSISLTRGLQMHRYANPEYEARVVFILTQILESSSESLREIKWGGVTYLKGFTWPKNGMANLRRLELYGPRDLLGRSFVPTPGFSWSKSFPKLRHLSIGISDGDTRNKCENLEEFLASLNFDIMNCVRRVEIRKYSGQLIPPEHVKPVYELFPNACVTVKLGK